MKNLTPFLGNYFNLICGKFETTVLKDLVNYYPINSLKKRIIYFYLQTLFFTRLYKIFPTFQNNQIKSKLRKIDILAKQYFVFSQDVTLRKRLYAIGIDYENKAFFTKVIWGAEKEFAIKELEVEKYFGRALLEKSHLPKQVFRSDENIVLLYDLLPKTSKILNQRPLSLYSDFLENNLDRGLLHQVSIKDFNEFDWWLSFHSTRHKNFQDYFMQVVSDEDKFYVMFAHGDLGSDNLIDVDGELRIIDWEKSHTHAPKITDYLGIQLGNHHHSIIRDKNLKKSPGSLCKFYSQFIDSELFSFPEFLLGLSFYLGTNFNLAEFLITDFEV
ncbi:hypothetical protein [Christiangramia sp. OXR-203]|uniref:hypothetical protein n=1 Tax=Christiangramia sp. OXR-203 TaxID=3100176 RepID=UPI002AC94EB0|nr:hypothetical protein [Christiangramia sp. OXR-203]WPY98253.1 hypothetical protein T8I65_13865 [Christiangramia sp. OXR-203]